jgi:biopolymer transport protein ExbD
MGGSKRGADDLLSDINVTPLVDVTLVLLVVLMVSASTSVSRALSVNLPRATTGEARPATLELGIDASGRWSLGGEPIAPDVLAQRLDTLLSPTETRAVIAADGDARHQAVVGMLDLLGHKGVTNVAFAVHTEGP